MSCFLPGVRAVLPGSIGVRIVDCAALDGLGESSQKLLDDRGCPIDEQVRVRKQTLNEISRDEIINDLQFTKHT